MACSSLSRCLHPRVRTHTVVCILGVLLCCAVLLGGAAFYYRKKSRAVDYSSLIQYMNEDPCFNEDFDQAMNEETANEMTTSVSSPKPGGFDL